MQQVQPSLLKIYGVGPVLAARKAELAIWRCKLLFGYSDSRYDRGMPAEILKPSPLGRWERVQRGSYWWLLFIAILVSSILNGPLGFWPSTGLTIFVLAVWTFVLYRLASSEREARLMRDVERGLIECAVRYPNSIPGSLSDRWERGLAEVRNGKIAFQPLGSEMSSAGQTREFSQLSSYRSLGAPSKKPAELARSWKIAACETNNGALEVAAGESGLSLLADQSAPDPGRH